jgi:hypothetical protein
MHPTQPSHLQRVETLSKSSSPWLVQTRIQVKGNIHKWFIIKAGELVKPIFKNISLTLTPLTWPGLVGCYALFLLKYKIRILWLQMSICSTTSLYLKASNQSHWTSTTADKVFSISMGSIWSGFHDHWFTCTKHNFRIPVKLCKISFNFTKNRRKHETSKF